MNNLKQLLLGGSAIAIVTAGVIPLAHAQDNSNTSNIDTVEVSASRINLSGFQAPTPVSVLGLAQIQNDAHVDIGDELRELPQLYAGGTSLDNASNASRFSQGDGGVDFVSLRGFGAQRNLVLFDRQRVPESDILLDEVDISNIPTSVVSRVDVVTGGASAAWGSDAVTGVINIVINKTFEGFKGSAEYSNNTQIEGGTGNPIYQAQAVWGQSFFNGRLHTELAAEYTIHNSTVLYGQLPLNGRTFVYNPAYCNAVTYAPGATTGGKCSSLTGAPMQIQVNATGANNSEGGGLINTNTVGTTGSGLTANALKGIMFVGQNSQPTLFNYGTTSGTSSVCYNGCTNDQYSGAAENTGALIAPLALPYHKANYFSYTSFQITPDITASVQLNAERFSTRLIGGNESGTKTVYADNAFLPQSTQERFVCNGTASPTCLTTLSNGYNPFTETGASSAQPKQYATIGFDALGNAVQNEASTASGNNVYTMANVCSAVGVTCGFQNKVFYRGVFTLNGNLSDNWTWSSYIQWGENRQMTNVTQNISSARFSNALDAVLVTSSNVGNSGLPIGSIQCRVLLNGTPQPTSGINDVTGCQPINLFGYQNVSEAAVDWVKPGMNSQNSGALDQILFLNEQDSAEASVNGVLPWHLPAGDIGVAAGFDYRLEQAGFNTADPRSKLTDWVVGNDVPFENQYNVIEGYSEVEAPLLKDNIVESLDADVAGRITDYSSSGLVETWKLGLVSQVNDDWKLRGSLSYDIRAPSVYNLYSTGNIAGVTCQRLFPADQSLGTNPCFGVSGSNPNLVPEKSFTYTVGVVATPHWIPGLTASLDWYDIRLHGGIVTPSATLAEQNCVAGILVDGCNQIVFSQPGNTHSQILTTYSTPVNAALLTTAGLDFAVNYGFEMSDVSWGEIPGHMNLAFNGNYSWDFSQTLNGAYINVAGGSSSLYAGGSPDFKGALSAGYSVNDWSFGLKVRMEGAYLRDVGAPAGSGLALETVSYSVVNGVNVATVSTGQNGYGTEGSAVFVAPVVIPDLNVQYKISGNYTAFAAVDNFLNLPQDFANGGSLTTNGLRRSYSVGLRFSF